MPTDPRVVPGVRRIAVLRANALGDFVFALPALEALRAAYPDAEIVLLARAWHETLLERRPSAVDRVIALPEGIPADRGALEPHEERAILTDLSTQGWDLALQLHGGGQHSNPVVRALGARVTAGSRSEDAPELDRWIRYVYYQSELTRLLEVVGLVGATPVTLEPSLAVTDADRSAAAAAGADLADEAYAVLHAGASDPRRRWPPDRFAAVGDALAARGLRIALTGTPDERRVASAVAAAMRAPAIDLTGRLGLDGLVGLLAGAALVVSNDTGPLHVAAAVGTPTVGIYWVGNAINGGSLFRHRHRAALSWQLACPVCGTDCIRGSCDHDASFVADVTVGEITAAAVDLLDAASTAPTTALSPPRRTATAVS